MSGDDEQQPDEQSIDPVQAGGCWICHEGNGYEDDDMVFSMEFDAFYHPDCLPEGCDNLLDYETRKVDHDQLKEVRTR